MNKDIEISKVTCTLSNLFLLSLKMLNGYILPKNISFLTRNIFNLLLKHLLLFRILQLLRRHPFKQLVRVTVRADVQTLIQIYSYVRVLSREVSPLVLVTVGVHSCVPFLMMFGLQKEWCLIMSENMLFPIIPQFLQESSFTSLGSII